MLDLDYIFIVISFFFFFLSVFSHFSFIVAGVVGVLTTDSHRLLRVVRVRELVAHT